MIVWILIAGAAAAADWSAVQFDRPRLEVAAKPAVMIGLIGLVATADVSPPNVRPWIIAALVFGLIGDLALLPRIDRFIVGLGSFLIGHLAYVVAFALMWEATAWIVVGVIGACGLLLAFGRPIERSIRGSAMRLPVIAYIGVTSIVIIAGAGTGRWAVAMGALAFALSDGLLGSNRFVSPNPDRRVWVHVLYHLGQAAIVVGVLDATLGN